MDHLLVHGANHFLLLHDSIEDVVLFFERISELIFAALVAALFLLPPRASAQRLRRAAVGAVASAALAVACGAVIAALVDRPRPFVADPSAVHLFAAHASDAGFPSDHATAAFAIAAAVFPRDRVWGGVLLAAAALVAAGRVAIGVHYPTDVLAGALLGCAAAWVCWTPLVRGVTDAAAGWIGGVVDRISGRTAVPAETA